MPAYMILIREKLRDAEAMKRYAEGAGEARHGHDLKPLAFYGACETLEAAQADGVVVIEFPDRAAARPGMTARPMRPRGRIVSRGRITGWSWSTGWAEPRRRRGGADELRERAGKSARRLAPPSPIGCPLCTWGRAVPRFAKPVSEGHVLGSRRGPRYGCLAK